MDPSPCCSTFSVDSLSAFALLGPRAHSKSTDLKEDWFASLCYFSFLFEESKTSGHLLNTQKDNHTETEHTFSSCCIFMQLWWAAAWSTMWPCSHVCQRFSMKSPNTLVITAMTKTLPVKLLCEQVQNLMLPLRCELSLWFKRSSFLIEKWSGSSGFTFPIHVMIILTLPVLLFSFL